MEKQRREGIYRILSPNITDYISKVPRNKMKANKRRHRRSNFNEKKFWS
jgi:hypothetical protein